MAEIKISVTVIGGIIVVVVAVVCTSWLMIRGVYVISSNNPTVHPNSCLMNQSGRDVLDLDFHTPEPLPVPPLQYKIRRRRLSIGIKAGSLGTAMGGGVARVTIIAAPQ